jgi:geranylgeranyl diphosphate synthase type I
MLTFDELLAEVGQRADLVRAYLLDEQYRPEFAHPHLQDAIYSYVKAGGKALRPAVLMFCCGAVGGDEAIAIPAGAAVELYHTWTLVHDDIIDRDDLRRGGPTVHAEFRDRARDELGFDAAKAAHYGLSIAILAGDIQQGWCTSLLTNLTRENGLPADLSLGLLHDLFTRVQHTLVDGEALDILYAETPVEQLSAEKVIDMLWKKTGVLYDFAGRAGAAIGLQQPDITHPDVERIAAYTGRCGTAFQIQDDILGVVGDAKMLGKPVGADIREGKRTLVVLGALPNMSAGDRDFTLSVLGNDDASEDDIRGVTGLLRKAGGIDFAQKTAREYVQSALEGLDELPDSRDKDLLVTWGRYLIEREF